MHLLFILKLIIKLSELLRLSPLTVVFISAVFLTLAPLTECYVVRLCRAVSQPKRNFNTMRSPKDLTSESSISR